MKVKDPKIYKCFSMKKVKEVEPINTDATAAYKKFLSIFTNHFPSKGHGEVFNDFLDFVLWFLSRPFGDLVAQEVRDNAALIDKKYAPKEEGTTFAQMFDLFITAADNDGKGLHDVLGDLFMELVSHGKNGQFFTPQHICDFMAVCMSFITPPKSLLSKRAVITPMD